MEYYYFCLVILFLFIYFFLFEIIQDIKKHRASLYIIPFCLLLTILYKYNHGIEFWGLEYEDSYSFSFCARQFSHEIYPSSFLIDAISMGSLDKPISIFTYGGHFITYPVFLSIFTQPLGWSPLLISIINTSISFFILLVLSFIGNNQKYWFVAPTIYCISPIINVFTTCFLSEIFSSFICISFIYGYFKSNKNIKNNYLCLIAFGVALLCKRENIALIFIPLLDSFISNHKLKIKEILINVIKHNIPFFIIIFIYIFGCQNIFNIEKIESNDIGEMTFSFENFRRLLPVFLKSLFSINSFSISLYMYIGYLLYLRIKHKSWNKIQWISITTFIIYLLLYTFHYRGYFFIKGGKIECFDSYRYINNFYYFIPLIFCTFSTKKIQFVSISLVLLSSLSFFQTRYLRNYFSELEHESRFKEVEIVSKFIENKNKNCVLICENILLYQNLCKSNFSICCITLFDKIKFENNKIEYYCLFPNLEYIKERYDININKEKFTPILKLPNNNYLYHYNSITSKNNK